MTYPLDKVIRALNNWDLVIIGISLGKWNKRSVDKYIIHSVDKTKYKPVFVVNDIAISNYLNNIIVAC